MLVDKEKILLRYEEYFTDLLESKELHSEYVEHHEVILQNHEMYMNIKTYDNDDMNKPFNIEELNTVIKRLKKEKCPGPDEFYNELIINAGKNLRDNILEMLNLFWMEEVIPEELYKIDIKTLYKGKGDTAKLQNQRGLFLSSSILKLYEMMMMLRGGPKIHERMSQYQAGGRPQHSTNEQTFILRSISEYQKYYKKLLYMQFYDLKKAFDKMILKYIMQGLWEIGIRGRMWRNTFIINMKAIIRIKTAIGNTREVSIGETLKQGSVMASTLAAFHIDCISNTIKNTGLGINYGSLLIPLLLFQDDIVKFDHSHENLQKSNIIFQSFQDLNRMEFHDEKTVIMTNSKDKPQIILNNKVVPKVDEYKYLGDVLTAEESYTELIRERRSAITGTVAELVTVTSVMRFNRKML